MIWNNTMKYPKWGNQGQEDNQVQVNAVSNPNLHKGRW